MKIIAETELRSVLISTNIVDRNFLKKWKKKKQEISAKMIRNIVDSNRATFSSLALYLPFI